MICLVDCVHLTRCFCSNKHPIGAIVWAESRININQAIKIISEAVQKAIKDDIINAECGRCGCNTWNFKDERTAYLNVAHAIPFIERMMFKQGLKPVLLKRA